MLSRTRGKKYFYRNMLTAYCHNIGLSGRTLIGLIKTDRSWYIVRIFYYIHISWQMLIQSVDEMWIRKFEYALI
jgi:hypothetical protein